MNKLLLSFILGIMFLSLVNAGTITTTLNSPADASIKYTNPVTFNATASFTASLVNISLYDNSSGAWTLKNTTNLHSYTSNQIAGDLDENSGSLTASRGNNFTAIGSYSQAIFETDSALGATRLMLYFQNGTYIGTANFDSSTHTNATMTWNFVNGVTYVALLDANGNSYAETYKSANLPKVNTTISWRTPVYITGNKVANNSYGVFSDAGGGLTYFKNIWTSGTTSSSTQTFTNTYSSGQTIKWNTLVCDSDNVCNFAVTNYTFKMDSTSPSITINSGSGTQANGNLANNYTITYTPSDNNLDSCVLSYNSINRTLSCTNNSVNSVNFTLSAGVNSAIIYANDSLGNINKINVNWNFAYFQNSNTYSTTTTSLANENYVLNFALNTSLFNSISGSMVYNGINYPTAITTSGSNYILNYSRLIPAVNTQTNYTFYYSLLLNYINGTQLQINTSSYNQTINIIGIDNCSTYTNKILNLTMFDEDTNAKLDISNASIRNGTMQINVRLSNPADPTNYQQYSVIQTNINPSEICVSNGVLSNTYRLDGTVQYSATSYITRFYYVQNYLLNSTTAPLNRTLYNLLNTQSQEFKIIYKDATFLPVPNAVIEIQKNFVGAGYYAPVEDGLTDNYGTTVGHFVLGTNSYAIYVYINGVLTSTYPNVQPICNNIATGDCQINLNALTSSYQFTNWLIYTNLNYLYNFNSSGRTLGLTWSLQDVNAGTSNITLSVKLSDALTSDGQICYISTTASSGIYNCAIADSFGNTTIEADLYKDGVFIQQDYFGINNGSQNIFGNTGIILGFIIFVCIVLMFTDNPTAILIGGILGILAIGTLGFINFNNSSLGSQVGLGATIVSIIIVIGILLWQINKSSGGVA